MIPQHFRFDAAMTTHEGKIRHVNEDNFLFEPDLGVWMVADGMGGHKNGKLASATVVNAVKTIGRAASASDLVARFADRIQRANDELIEISQGDDAAVSGSTVAALLTFERQYACAWAGDSRVYLVRSGVIRQLSRDHTEVQELLDQGVIKPAEAKTWPRRNVITRAVGVFEDPGLDVTQGELSAGDRFVLCSDGLTGHVEDAEILKSVASGSARSACDGLLQLALERGGKDNVTIIVVNTYLQSDLTHRIVITP